MDPELKTLLTALVDGQTKLAEGQARTDATVRQLAEAQLRTEQALERLTGRVDEIGARIDRLAELMIRGFTKVAERQTQAEQRLDRLEGAGG